MPIDTRIDGDPASIRSVSHWLRSSLAPGLTDAATQIYQARNRADAGWHGAAGDAFRAKATRGAENTDGLSGVVTTAAQEIDNYAAQLQRVQDDMRYIRECAVEAGLIVTGDAIEEPAPVSGAAGDPTRTAAYETARTQADAARHIAQVAADTLRNVQASLTEKWFLVLGDITIGAAATLAAKHSSILGKQAQFLACESARLLERAPMSATSSQVYRDVDMGRAAAGQADDIAAMAKNVEAGAARWGLRAGGALTVGGIAYDVAHGKPAPQAIVVGGVGFGASVAAGAAIGTMVPVPVLGTAVGAAGGAVVGIFASGAADSLWQNGIGDVGGAVADGAEAVGTAGQAVTGLAGDAWDAAF